MYSVILVDDEEEIREGIIRKIKWDEFGFKIVGSAENGKEALELAEKLQPDVIMTDIMMPFMDGLCLCEELTKKFPLMKLIIFSGVDDLDYAHRAIKLNVVEYVLKPVDAKNLGKTLENLKSCLDEELEKRRDLEVLKQHYIDSLPVIKEHFLDSLASGRISEKEIVGNAGLVDINLNSKYFGMSLLGIDKDVTNDENLFKGNDYTLVTITIKDVTHEIMSKYHMVSCFLFRDKIGVLYCIEDKKDILQIISGMSEICNHLSKIFGLSVTAGIGGLVNRIIDVKYSCQEAQNALDYRVVLGNKRAIYIRDVEPDTTKRLTFRGNEENNFISAVKMGNDFEIKRIVDNISNELSDKVLKFNQYTVYFMEVKLALLGLIQNYGLKDSSAAIELENMIDIYSMPSSVEVFKSWLLDITAQISNQIKRERVNSSSHLVEKAKKYVEINYSDYELTVDNLSSEMHVSPTYFSTIFKRETGSNFIAYLTDVRLQKAIEFLNTTDEKSYIIAEKVGYQEPNYFSYVFKKKYGVSPSRYRKQ